MPSCSNSCPDTGSPDALTARAEWLRLVVLPHEETVRRRLARWGVPQDAIEDVVHDAYVRLLNAADIAGVRDGRQYFSRSARSVVLTRARRSQCVHEEPHDPDCLSFIPSTEPSGERALDARRELDRVEQAFQGLGARTREVVYLRRIERLTGRETAVRLAISESAVEKHLGSGMKRLRAAAAVRSGETGAESGRLAGGCE